MAEQTKIALNLGADAGHRLTRQGRERYNPALE
jgi:hypothetical protein